MGPSKNELIIPFVGLKLGKQSYNFQIDDTFFEQLEYSPINQGDLKVTLELEKKETMLIAIFTVNGDVSVNCDRCDAPMSLEIAGDLEIIYKFGTEDSGDENLIVLFPEEYQIDVSDPIYQMIVTALPSRRIHAPGECNEEMWELIQKYTINSDASSEDDEEEDDEEEDNLGFDDFDPNDPKWGLLKDKK